MRILLVDDQPEIWHGLVQRNLPTGLIELGVHEIQLSLSVSAPEAAKVIETSEPFDLIICDGLRVGQSTDFGWKNVREAAQRKGQSRFMLFSDDSVVEEEARAQGIPFYGKLKFDLDIFPREVKRVLDTPLHPIHTVEAP